MKKAKQKGKERKGNTGGAWKHMMNSLHYQDLKHDLELGKISVDTINEDRK
jgi:hypothetical protein